MLFKESKFSFILWIIIFQIVFIVPSFPHVNKTELSEFKSFPKTSESYYNLEEEILDSKISNYNSLGYFSQIFKPSLQATYYALYTLDELGRLSSINQIEIVNYIMSCYRSSTHLFIDDYTRRYLDIDISKTYYPYTSLLEANCYAILSLDLLDSLNLIDIQESIDFIWSCYQPVTSGFMGQPYDYWLPEHFKLSTADNTYFAIITLDLLMSNWNGYLNEKNDLIQYIGALQSTNTFYWYLGGFENDKDTSIDSIDIFEPNLLSSYYCIKALDIFGMIDTINKNNFYQYLDGLYESLSFRFDMAYYVPYADYGNIVATSLGLILSDLTGYSGINRNSVLNFILSNRNNKGIWNYSTSLLYCELIDTFQVIRALSEAGELTRLTENDKDAISISLLDFMSYYGFSLLSKDYTSIKLLYSIINSFDLYNRTSELNYPYLFSLIEDACIYLSVSDCEGFNAGLPFEESIRKYRSFPIEYYSSGTQEHLQYVENSLLSHKNTFQALQSLQVINKLDDFAASHNLNDLLQSILNSQFLETGYENYGGFLPFLSFSSGTPEYQNSKIFLDYAYYAIRIIELLSDYLGLGDIVTLPFDISALSNYIHSNIIEDINFQYYAPGYSVKPTTLIENTFFAIYILKSLNCFDLDDIKIKNFCENYINYSDIKSVYYSYKISEILSEKIIFNYDLIYQLIGDLYSETYKEYFLTKDMETIDHEIILWIAELVTEDLRNSNVFINIDHLESCKFLSSGNNITFTINAKFSGTYWFWIDEELIDSDIFTPDGETITYSLDEYTDKIKDYNVKINATAIDETYGATNAIFSVYSDSSTIINIISLENYEYGTTGHNISFSIHSQYPDRYNFTINNNEISSGTFYDGQIFTFSIDEFEVDPHEVYIWAIGLDEKVGEAYATFTVYSTSETIINVHSIDNYIYNTTGNNINFSISSDFPENFSITIDNEIVKEGIYTSNISILYSIDGYGPGLHWVTIWANSSNKKEATTSVQFDVFNESFLEIEIRNLHSYEFKSIDNYFLFYLNSSFPDSYCVNIDGEIIGVGIYHYGGELFNYSIDGYFIGEHNISIWANSTDGKESTCESSFSVYSLSNTIVNIEELPDYEFMTTGHFVKFNISSLYPDYYILSIDGVEVNTSDYISERFYYYSIDGYSIGYHTLLIWAIGEDDKEGTASTGFNVYSNSTTLIEVHGIPNYEFMTEGNYINFSISSMYNGNYNISINDVLIEEGLYTVGTPIMCLSDGYSVGEHTVLIFAKSFDGKMAEYNTTFTVYSNSITVINIHTLEGCEFMSTNNFLNFSIYSDYPDYYSLTINDVLVKTDNFSSGEYILYSLENYTSTIGNYSIIIWAIGKDGKESNITAEFCVYSTSVTLITIHHLQGCEFMSKGNFINFSIHSDYPDYYILEINNILITTSNYSNDEYITYSLDNYTSTIGIHDVYIWAIGKDGKEASILTQFNIYSSSETLIKIDKLEDCEYLATGNVLIFTIFSDNPEYYELFIDQTFICKENYSNGVPIIFSLNNYSNDLGNHTVVIYAKSLDSQSVSVESEFKVFSTSDLKINIIKLNNYEFNSTGNELIVNISSKYSINYTISIDNIVVEVGSYSKGQILTLSIDNYNIGQHNVTIWAKSLDGKEKVFQIIFIVYFEDGMDGDEDGIDQDDEMNEEDDSGEKDGLERILNKFKQNLFQYLIIFGAVISISFFIIIKSRSRLPRMLKESSLEKQFNQKVKQRKSLKI
ncbi:MAG: hypothetical protein ACFFDH_01010 [Promethearchaeota archaeon]